jgi:hypothetical protein
MSSCFREPIICSSTHGKIGQSSHHITSTSSSPKTGLQLNIRPKVVEEKSFGGLPARNRTAMVRS